MSALARARANYRALRALDGGRSPIASASIDAVVLLLVLLDVLAIAAFVPAMVGLAVWS